MQLTHTFSVPAGIEQTWAALGDIESVAGCFPGAQVTSADESSFEGTVKVKLGPIALVYKGSGEFVDKDGSAHRMAIKALGKDKRGNGTAGADVVATMTELGPSSTQVEVVTDLNVTGKPAQFGRGVMQDVSDKLLGQFVDCLAGRLGASDEPAAASQTSAPEPATTSVPAPTAAPTPTPTPAPARSASSSAGSADAIDLGATALPVLLKAYGPQLAAALGGLALLVCLLRRRRD
ncbi:carbon monoxide dehydrogenase [Janibacter sp. Soil728]|uniref:SRPBCC family protein n=1 Tax=Janibacter sp. Soil728 TaxID=1736393 RepID=UPI0007014963|nr:SRPBCC family protein [Janibacter sp. Soil728]KRE36040.1 carbon monoxide dehydrogenase [Janibacter sp. Soil728]